MLVAMTKRGHNSASAAEVDFGCTAPLADNFAVAHEEADKGFGFVEGERAADQPTSKLGIGEDELDVAARVEAGNDVGQRSLGEISEPALPRERGAQSGGIDFLDGGERGVFRQDDALAGGDESGLRWSALTPTGWIGCRPR